jgi:hypothetical protein
MVEFSAANPHQFRMERYECNAAAHHRYWYIENAAFAGGRKAGAACPAPGCAGVLASNWVSVPIDLGLPAVGCPLGATWLFWRGENNNRLRIVWVHEVGHHRHLEHAASGPGAKANLHDSENNTTVAGGTWAALPGAGDHAPAQQWDHICIMSYSDAWHNQYGMLCGRCLLRYRGWRITGLGFPAANQGEP